MLAARAGGALVAAARGTPASGVLCLLLACGGLSSSTAGPPLWERPGLYGAIRPRMGPPSLVTPRPTSSRGVSGRRHVPVSAAARPLDDARTSRPPGVPTATPKSIISVSSADAYWRAGRARRARGREGRTPGTGANTQPVTSRAPTRCSTTWTAACRAGTCAAEGADVARGTPAGSASTWTVIVDPRGIIRMFLFPDSKHFDPTFGAVRPGEPDRLLAGAPSSPAAEACWTTDRRERGRGGDERETPRVAPGESAAVVIALSIALAITSCPTARAIPPTSRRAFASRVPRG